MQMRICLLLTRLQKGISNCTDSTPLERPSLQLQQSLIAEQGRMMNGREGQFTAGKVGAGQGRAGQRSSQIMKAFDTTLVSLVEKQCQE